VSAVSAERASAGRAVVTSHEVEAALADRRPVVALESTIFSRLGLPAPHNAEALARSLAAVRAGGAVPAVTAVLDGVARVGLADAEHERILAGDRKVAERDLGPALAAGAPVAVTTVSATVALAAATGIAVFATGGIGGVHRGAEASFDVSSDLTAVARHPVTTVCAGAKGFLDLPKTMEYLETLGVPVVGLDTWELPAFWSRSSGLTLAHRVDDAAGAAGVVRAVRRLGATHGVLVVNPCPEDAAIARSEMEPRIEEALAAAAAAGITGAAVTPAVLEHLARATGGRTLVANLALAEHNAAQAAAVAVSLAAGP
jgi:pseudouridine-5'-phosphate glycosidase